MLPGEFGFVTRTSFDLSSGSDDHWEAASEPAGWTTVSPSQYDTFNR